tara:strand:- start:168 stop:935 length:768 start_codon:yes stop_codon:yes gene_type:complete
MSIQIFNEDCLKMMKELPDKSIDLFICDLPYGEVSCKWDSVIDIEEFWKQFKRLRKSKRTACIHFCSTKFGYTLIKSNEKMFKMDMVWKKRNKTGGLQSKYRPMRNHEMVYFFYEQAPKYNRDKYHKRIAVSATKKEDNIKSSKNHINVHGLDKSHPTWAQHNSFIPPNPPSVLEPVTLFESETVLIGKRHHQTEKPQDILEFFLKYWSDEGDVILDVTMGSGSTGIACKNLGRNFIGYELDKNIFEVARKRLEL